MKPRGEAARLPEPHGSVVGEDSAGSGRGILTGVGEAVDFLYKPLDFSRFRDEERNFPLMHRNGNLLDLVRVKHVQLGRVPLYQAVVLPQQVGQVSPGEGRLGQQAG